MRVFAALCATLLLTIVSLPAQTPASLETARKALEGRWTLVSLDVTAADGRSASVEATGTMVVDSFSTVSLEYRISPAGLKTLAGLGVTMPNAVISTSGRAIIDTQQKRITYAAEDFEKRMSQFDRDLDARRRNPFAPERTRHYALEADGVLRLATRYEDGKDALVGRWKKEPGR